MATLVVGALVALFLLWSLKNFREKFCNKKKGKDGNGGCGCGCGG